MATRPHDPSAWQLRWDIVSTHTLLFVTNPTGSSDIRPHVHGYLADRYASLARYHRQAGRVRRAATLEQKATYHYRFAQPPDPPPAVSVALPVPTGPVRVEAVSTYPVVPEDAA